MRRVLTQSVLAVMLASTLGAAPDQHPAAKPIPPPKFETKKPSKPYQVGRASWYGALFQGKTTAAGEAYDMNQLTAAHPELPLGSFIRVTNLGNGRKVVVRVNDRGPVTPGRVIDLSYKAAQLLGFHKKGVQKVRIDLIHDTNGVLTATNSPPAAVTGQ